MDDSEIDIRGILGLLRRRLRLIVLTVVVVVGVAGIVAFALTPIYSATALVLVDPSRKNLLEPETQFTATSADNARIDSEVEILRSDSILLKVVASQNLLASEEFGVSVDWRTRLMSFLRLSQPPQPNSEDMLNATLAKLRGAFSAQRRGMTYLIAVQARSEEPEMAARLANAISEAYIEDQLASKVTSTLASRDILQSRIIEARDAIVASEGAFDSFIESNIQRITESSGSSQLAEMQEHIRTLSDMRRQSAAAAERAQQSLGAGDWQTLIASLQTQALATYEAQREEIEARLIGLEDTSPTAINLRRELAVVEENLRSQATADLANLRQTITSAQEEEDRLRQEMRRQVLGSTLPAEVLAELYELQQGAEIARSQYQLLLSRSQDLDTQATLQVADSRIVSPALAPRVPSFPNKTLIIALAGLGALGLGIALAFLYENLIGGFTTEEQMESVLKSRVASAIPRTRPQAEGVSLSDLMVNSPLSAFAEAIRRIRAIVDQQARAGSGNGPESGGRVVMISSTAPNEGKTTLALALARSYALSGRRTLLVDCDLRKPSVHRQLGIEPSHGLHDYLDPTRAEPMNLISIISKDHLTEATVIVGARKSDVPTDQLLASTSFGKLIEAARSSFEVVVLDTPPIGPVVDGLYVAPFADSIVFVTKWASTSQSDTRKAIEALTEAKRPGTPIVTALNQQDEPKTAYYRKYGGYYQEA